MSLLPCRLEPVFVPRIWGAHALKPLFPEKTDLTEPVGEAWMTGNGSQFANGPLAGDLLGDVWPSLPAEWTGHGGQGKSFPLLAKFLFPQEKLSVQVHPSDQFAQEMEADAGGVGKTEMWYAIDAKPGAGVLVNLKPGVTPASLRRAIAEGTAENSLEFVTLAAGESVFVPAGSIHTIGPGLILCEIQQNSDITYRVFDYNRRDARGELRPLHLEKALATINFGKQTGGKIKPVKFSEGTVNKTFYVGCRHFATEKWEFAETIRTRTSAEHFDLLIILEGEGAMECGGGAAPYAAAQVWLLPAGLGEYQLAPRKPTALLRSYVPADLAALAKTLAEQGVSPSDAARLIYP